MKQFKTPSDADRHYFPKSGSPVQPYATTKVNVEVQTDIAVPPGPTQSGVGHLVSSTRVTGDENTVVTVSTQTDPADPAEFVVNILGQLSAGAQLEAMSKFFSEYALANFSLTVPEDFLSLAAKAMAKLKHSERSNVLYNLAKGIGTPRDDGSDSRFPTQRMPMGLVEHIANFVADKMQKVSGYNSAITEQHALQQVYQFVMYYNRYQFVCHTFFVKVPSCPTDYRLWQQTMYTQFGQKWSKLHHGPLWSVVSSAQSSEAVTSRSQKRDTMDVCTEQAIVKGLNYILSILYLLGLGEYPRHFREEHSS